MRPAIAVLLVLAGCAVAPSDPSDAPESRQAGAYPPAAHYAQALATWRGAEDVNAFIGSRFEYDRERAIGLSETQRANGRPAITPPAEFFVSPRGVCVDLSRFAVETLRAVDAPAKPMYLMIEFEPVTVGGNILRLHWLASYRRDGKYFFFADSKRPGDIAGPYATVDAFIADYERYRGRKVVRWRELESYERKVRHRASRQERHSSTSRAQ